MGARPTGVVVKQEAGWTYGVLANHVWSVGGPGGQDISNTFVQPFLSYTTRTAWTFGVNTESTYDWKHEQWTGSRKPYDVEAHALRQAADSFGVGARYYADSPSSGAHGFGVRLTVTLLFAE